MRTCRSPPHLGLPTNPCTIIVFIVSFLGTVFNHRHGTCWLRRFAARYLPPYRLPDYLNLTPHAMGLPNHHFFARRPSAAHLPRHFDSGAAVNLSQWNLWQNTATFSTPCGKDIKRGTCTNFALALPFHPACGHGGDFMPHWFLTAPHFSCTVAWETVPPAPGLRLRQSGLPTLLPNTCLHDFCCAHRISLPFLPSRCCIVRHRRCTVLPHGGFWVASYSTKPSGAYPT